MGIKYKLGDTVSDRYLDELLLIVKIDGDNVTLVRNNNKGLVALTKTELKDQYRVEVE